MTGLNIKNLVVKNMKDTKYNHQEIFNLLKILDDDFYPSLSSIVELDAWSKKLFNNAYNLIVINPENKEISIIAMLSFYCNDEEKQYSFIPIIGVLKEYRSKGLSKLLLSECLKILKQKGFKELGIRTWSGNLAYNIYKSFGFKEIKRINDRPNGVFSIYLELKL